MVKTTRAQREALFRVDDDGVLVEIIARAIEQQICSQYEWTPEQFEMWWTKDSRNHNHKQQRWAQATYAIVALRKKGYDIVLRD